MNQKELLKFSDALHKEGEKALKQSGILNALEEYGEVNIHGGFSYNLLLKPDIDIHLIAKDFDKKEAEALVSQLIRVNLFAEVSYVDHFEHNDSIERDTGRRYPDGHYIGLKYFFDSKMWGIDIFILKAEQPEIAGLQKYFDNCPDDIRAEILKSKIYIAENKLNFPAKIMYDKFIDGTFKSSNDFIRSIKK